MTKQEKDCIFDEFEKSLIKTDESMTLDELKAYVKGFEDARYKMFDAVDKCYRSLQTDQDGGI